jgi:signal peptidase I
MQDYSIDKKIKVKHKSPLLETLIDIFEAFIKALAFIIILTVFMFKICTVVGDSMYNTLHNGERLIISNIFYTPTEGDIIVFHDTKSLNEPIVKRVIATGNKWVKIDYDNSLLYVSDDEFFDKNDLVDESDYVYFDIGRYELSGTFETFVPEGYIFVMGDNRNNSTDSRSPQISLVDERTVLGKVIIRVFPLNKFEIIH